MLFLEIPAELRNMVYGHLIDTDQIIACNAVNSKHKRPPAITQVCPKIRAETVPMYYGSNKFQIECAYQIANQRNYERPLDALCHWIEGIGVAQFKHINSINIWIRDAGINHEVLLQFALLNGNFATEDVIVRTRRSYSGRSSGCNTFDYYIYRKMVSENILGGEHRHQHDDEHAEEMKLNPPSTLHIKSDVFTVLSIIQAAFHYHCYCCFKEPGTILPCGRIATISYRRPSLELPSRTLVDELERIRPSRSWIRQVFEEWD